MRDQAGPAEAAARKGRLADAAPYVLIAGGILLAWQVAIQPVMQRAPAEVAVRVAPGSPLVLRRAAEAEFLAGEQGDDARRYDNAASLARDALARAPFDVRALRVVGLTEARAGRLDRADDILTLAGNWSLRDDPAHAWLVQHRLRRGDYASAFAHADTLARRRDDIRPRIFTLFTVAATQDPQRALPQVARLMAARPPWRQAYLDSLFADARGLQVAVNLAVLLQADEKGALDNEELRRLYYQLLDKGLIDAVRTVRERLNRPPATTLVSNGGFDTPSAPEPFQWKLSDNAGVIAEIVPDDVRPADPALRIDYDGYATARIAEQLMFLAPGRYRLSAESRAEAGSPAERLALTLICSPGDAQLLSTPAARAGTDVWTPLSATFAVPSGCASQWLRLETRPGDRRQRTVVWLDRIGVTRIAPGSD